MALSLLRPKKVKIAPAHMRLGRSGEWTARAFMHALGYEIRGSNIRLGRHEIDLLCFDPIDKVLVFAEVKARARDSKDYRPEVNITRRKRSSMAHAARKWVAKYEYEGGYRMDVVCIANGRVVDHFKEIAWE